VETRVLSGKEVARAMREEMAERVSRLSGEPRLAVVLVGDDPASRIYSASIERSAGRLGISADLVELDAALGSEGVAKGIRALSDDPSVHGIIVQQPLPGGVDPRIVEEIAPPKDVDCATTYSMGLLMTGGETFVPCTAKGVIEILSRSGIEVSGRHVVIVGRSNVVGKPLANLLLRKARGANATVTVCHTGTRDLRSHTLAADVLVAAMGRPEAIRGDMVAEGAVVVDVGVNSIDDPDSEKGYRVVGDVAFDEVMGRASAVTPVPGGVGTLTTTILLDNVVRAAERADAP
jgi:methylenetetrahydrofolate dehydrogenase (NADP+)/methenyltetrahydrofolate cyclohydrolase